MYPPWLKRHEMEHIPATPNHYINIHQPDFDGWVRVPTHQARGMMGNNSPRSKVSPIHLGHLGALGSGQFRRSLCEGGGLRFLVFRVTWVLKRIQPDFWNSNMFKKEHCKIESRIIPLFIAVGFPGKIP